MAGSKGTKYYDVFLKYKIWLAHNETTILDEYLLCLLDEIEKSGSIMKASKELNVSYRKAWGDIKKAEEVLGFHFVEKTRGGKDGGTTVLTDDGKNIVNAYKELKSDFNESVSRITKKFFNTINSKK
jgi:molybdate transport system regulatory protein